MKKKFLVIPLFVLLGVGLVIAGYIGYSASLSADVDKPFNTYMNESGTWIYNLGNIYSGDNVSFTAITDNWNNNRSYDVYPLSFQIQLDENWKSEYVDSFYLNENLISKDCIFHVREDETTIPFSNIDSENTDFVRLIYDSNCDGILDKYNHGAGETIVNKMNIVTNPTFPDTNINLKSCVLYNLDNSCADIPN